MSPAPVLRRYFAAWERGDVSALQQLLADDVRATGPLATVEGASAHAASLANSSSLFSRITIENVVEDGTTVITWFYLVLQDGTPIAASNRCEVIDGTIRTVEVVFDPRPLVAAARGPSS